MWREFLTQLPFLVPMLAGALLAHQLRALVDGLLLLPELRVGPEIQVAHDDVHECILCLRAPQQLLQVVRARGGGGVGGGLREHQDLYLSRRAVGSLTRGSDLEEVVVLLAPDLHQRTTQENGDPVLGDLSPVLLDELEARL